MGLSLDLTANGLGIRTARYALILDDLVIKYIGVNHVNNLRTLLNSFLARSNLLPALPSLV